MKTIIRKICEFLEINETLGYGLVWSGLIASIVCFIFSFILMALTGNKLVSLIVPIFPFVGICWNIYQRGLVTVPVQHRGVILRAKRRRADPVLREGDNWIWPIWPIKETFIPVNIGERIVPIGTEESPFIVSAMAPHKEGAPSPPSADPDDLEGREGDITMMKLSYILRWRIENDAGAVIRFLNTKGEEDVQTEVITIVNSTLREVAAKTLDTMLMKEKGKFGQAALDMIKAEDKGQISELQDIGVDPKLSIVIKKVEPKSEKIREAMEKQREEEFQMRGEGVETDNLIRNITKLHKGLGGKVSMEFAANVYQAERQKARRWIIDGSAPSDIKGEVAGGASWGEERSTP